jgi:hypothetical protein
MKAEEMANMDSQDIFFLFFWRCWALIAMYHWATAAAFGVLRQGLTM